MTRFETDHMSAARALDGNNFNLNSDFLLQTPYFQPQTFVCVHFMIEL